MSDIQDSIDRLLKWKDSSDIKAVIAELDKHRWHLRKCLPILDDHIATLRFMFKDKISAEAIIKSGYVREYADLPARIAIETNLLNEIKAITEPQDGR